MTLGQRISLYRKKLHISQEELGARLGVSRQAVSKWETDLSTPDTNNLLGLAREFRVSVAELTETPEEPSAAQDPALPPSPSQLETDASRRNASGTCWWAGLIIGAVLLFLSAGYLLYRINQPPAGQVSDYAEPASDFYLQWQVPRTDGREWYEFLTLGNQDVPFPFHTSLQLTAPEEIVTEGTDLHLAAVHHAVCGGLYVDYIRFQTDPEQGQAAGDTICRISTMAPGFWTPRGISVGDEKSFVVDAYHSGKEDQADGTLLYGLKEDGYSLVPHDYLYIWSAFEEGRGYQTIYFFMKDGLVAGISMELMQDLGDFYAAPNNTSTFPVDENGDPDYTNRQPTQQEPVDAARQVYIAWNQLVTNQNLSAEERYTNQWTVFSNLSQLDWQEFGQLGTTERPSDTIESLFSWLNEQAPYSEAEILQIQMGCAAKGLDGAYTEMYCHLLSQAFFENPASFAKGLACDGAEAVMSRAVRLTAYDAELYPAELKNALSTLDAAISSGMFSDAELGWAKLLRLYLITPINDRNELPETPAGLQG